MENTTLEYYKKLWNSEKWGIENYNKKGFYHTAVRVFRQNAHKFQEDHGRQIYSNPFIPEKDISRLNLYKYFYAKGKIYGESLIYA